MSPFQFRIPLLLACLGISFGLGINSAQAETVVSQTFPGPIVYFDTNVKTKYLFSDGNFYSGTNPSTAQIWADTGVSTTAFDDFDYYEFTTDSGVAFGDYSYISTQGVHFGPDEDNPWDNQIWRLGKKDGNLVFELAFEHPKHAEFDQGIFELFTLNDALFAVTGKGQVWRTKNGTTWKKLFTYHFPKDANATDYHAYSKGTKVYISYVGADVDRIEIAYSTDGTHWTNETNRFNDVDTSGNAHSSGIKSMTGFDYYVYALMEDGQGQNSIWKKSTLNNTDQWTQVLEQTQDIAHIRADSNDQYLFLVANSSISRCYNITSCSTNFYLDSGSIAGVITPKNKTNLVFLVADNGSYYLVRN